MDEGVERQLPGGVAHRMKSRGSTVPTLRGLHLVTQWHTELARLDQIRVGFAGTALPQIPPPNTVGAIEREVSECSSGIYCGCLVPPTDITPQLMFQQSFNAEAFVCPRPLRRSSRGSMTATFCFCNAETLQITFCLPVGKTRTAKNSLKKP